MISASAADVAGTGARRRVAVHLPAVVREGPGNLRDRQHQIHGAGQDGAARHAVVSGLARVLDDDEPAFP